MTVAKTTSKKTKHDEIILITGASRGIGAAIARGLANSGRHLVLVARNEEKLNQVKDDVEKTGAAARCYGADLSDKGVCHQLINQIESDTGPIDILINNAGVGFTGSVAEIDLEEFDTMLDLNVRAVVHLTRRVLPKMIERRRGAVINIASMAAHFTSAGMAGYAASKHAVLGFSNSLFDDVRDYGIKVSAICPGYVTTDMVGSNGRDLSKMIQPQDITEAVRYVLQSSPHVCPFEIHLRPQQSQ